MATRNLSLPEITESQAGKYITHNAALHLLDVYQGGVVSRTGTNSPLSQGEAYIVDAATGDWSSFSVGDIAVYYLDSSGAPAWLNYPPVEGPVVYVQDENTYVTWNGSTWVVMYAVLDATEVTGSKTLGVSDVGKIQRVTAAATITIPMNADAQIPVGAVIPVFRDTASAVTVAGSSPSPTIYGSTSLSSQGDMVTLMKVDQDTWRAN
jgi:hypothetical protein